MSKKTADRGKAASKAIEDVGAPHFVVAPKGPAAAAVRDLAQGRRIVGLTKGQFSLLDLIQAVIAHTGPADVELATWSTGIKDAETARWLVEQGPIRRLRILIDRSFPSRHPRYAARLVRLFGPGALVPTRVHAKVAVITNDAWTVTIQSSMNLNRNRQFEQFNIDTRPEVARFFGEWIEAIATAGPDGLEFETSEVEATFAAALREGVTASAAQADMLAETGEETSAREQREEATARKVEARARREKGVRLAALDREGLLRWELRRLSESIEEGDAGTVAFIQALKAIRAVHREMEDVRALADQEAASAVTLSPEERATQMAQSALKATDDELEIFVSEWLGRVKYDLRVDDGGVLRLDRHGLRLIG